MGAADKPEIKYDTIGYWTEIKLDIVRKYAGAYSKILSAQKRFEHIYVDAFAGPGVHISKTGGEFIKGSPLNALEVDPPFKEYHFIDLDRTKASALRSLVEGRDNCHVYEGDCNKVMLDTILPICRYNDYRRALWLLDPYGLHLDWSVIEAAGKEKSIDMFLNFPILDINRNVLRRDTSKVSQKSIERMDAFWGDNSWRDKAYTKTENLFDLDWEEKADSYEVVRAFRKRLRNVAGFSEVPEPMPMRNTQGGIVYYLFFASQKSVANNIVQDIFKKYRNKGPN